MVDFHAVTIGHALIIVSNAVNAANGIPYIGAIAVIVIYIAAVAGFNIRRVKDAHHIVWAVFIAPATHLLTEALANRAAVGTYRETVLAIQIAGRRLTLVFAFGVVEYIDAFFVGDAGVRISLVINAADRRPERRANVRVRLAGSCAPAVAADYFAVITGGAVAVIFAFGGNSIRPANTRRATGGPFAIITRLAIIVAHAALLCGHANAAYAVFVLGAVAVVAALNGLFVTFANFTAGNGVGRVAELAIQVACNRFALMLADTFITDFHAHALGFAFVRVCFVVHTANGGVNIVTATLFFAFALVSNFHTDAVGLAFITVGLAVNAANRGVNRRAFACFFSHAFVINFNLSAFGFALIGISFAVNAADRFP